ncbi:hypothetical protein GOP47_0010690 [Adiantum capillus-veneris]|uniref:Uncharacterized protein n=1 Tax=Adiantum capillus-veneris TaxID=13818 RepID=A0A9D4UVS1_ADICA|nr:hypothetical protein GOP47_0010690 [Adiantum capillus-veneris]
MAVTASLGWRKQSGRDCRRRRQVEMYWKLKVIAANLQAAQVKSTPFQYIVVGIQTSDKITRLASNEIFSKQVNI